MNALHPVLTVFLALLLTGCLTSNPHHGPNARIPFILEARERASIENWEMGTLNSRKRSTNFGGLHDYLPTLIVIERVPRSTLGMQYLGQLQKIATSEGTTEDMQKMARSISLRRGMTRLRWRILAIPYLDISLFGTEAVYRADSEHQAHFDRSLTTRHSYLFLFTFHTHQPSYDEILNWQIEKVMRKEIIRQRANARDKLIQEIRKTDQVKDE